MDATERAVAMGWTAVGVFLSTAMLFSFGADAWRGTANGFSYLWLLGFAGLFSFCLMRFRRFLLTAPGGMPPETHRKRRAVFAVVASVLVLAVFFGPLFTVAAERFQIERAAARQRQEAEAARQRAEAERQAFEKRRQEAEAEQEVDARRKEAEARADAIRMEAQQKVWQARATQEAIRDEEQREREERAEQRRAAREEKRAAAQQEAIDGMPPSSDAGGLGSGPVNPTPPTPEGGFSGRMRGFPGGGFGGFPGSMRGPRYPMGR
jgi:hypothetical protein